MNNRNALTAIFLFLMMAFAVACNGAQSETGPDSFDTSDTADTAKDSGVSIADLPNVIIVHIDTLRADAVGPDTTPYLWEWLQESLTGMGLAMSTWTRPDAWYDYSGCGSFSGCGPLEEGSIPDVETIAETFQEQGYCTALITNIEFGRDSNNHADGYVGVCDGFDICYYVQEKDQFVVDYIIDDVDWSDCDGPWMVQVQLFGPHAGYAGPPDGSCDLDDSEFPACWDTEIDFTDLDGMFDYEALALGSDATCEISEEQEDMVWDHAQCLYMGDVAETDYQIQRMMESFESIGLLDNAIVQFHSDHGEAFGEDHPDTVIEDMVNSRHDAGHLYGELANTFVAYWGTSFNAGTWEGIVSHTDMWPTIYSVLGFDIPDYMAGEPITDDRDYAVGSRFLPDEGRVSVSSVSSTASLICTVMKDAQDEEVCEFYDLVADPGQTNNLLKGTGGKNAPPATIPAADALYGGVDMEELLRLAATRF